MTNSADYHDWIGSRQTAEDLLTPRLAAAFCATFDLPESDPLPHGLHWCLAPALAAQAELGPDGHPQRGGFLPPVPLPRRMWAGGRLTLHGNLRVGDRVERVSTITSVAAKTGRSGPLCFVTVEHCFSTPRGVAIVEQQDIVYRGLDAASPAISSRDLPFSAEISREIDPSPVFLFRYSALTFNAHRIHYDRTYAMQAEQYAGLVVHGPLQATLLMQLAALLQPDAPLRHFTFRALQPLFDDGSFTLTGGFNSPFSAKLIASKAGAWHMEATASWQE